MALNTRASTFVHLKDEGSGHFLSADSSLGCQHTGHLPQSPVLAVLLGWPSAAPAHLSGVFPHGRLIPGPREKPRYLAAREGRDRPSSLTAVSPALGLAWDRRSGEGKTEAQRGKEGLA